MRKLYFGYNRHSCYPTEHCDVCSYTRVIVYPSRIIEWHIRRSLHHNQISRMRIVWCSPFRSRFTKILWFLLSATPHYFKLFLSSSFSSSSSFFLAFDGGFFYAAHCRSQSHCVRSCSLWPSPRNNCVEDTHWQGGERSGLQRRTHTMLMATVPSGSCCI